MCVITRTLPPRIHKIKIFHLLMAVINIKSSTESTISEGSCSFKPAPNLGSSSSPWPYRRCLSLMFIKHPQMLPFTVAPICFTGTDTEYQTLGTIFPLFPGATQDDHNLVTLSAFKPQSDSSPFPFLTSKDFSSYHWGWGINIDLRSSLENKTMPTLPDCFQREVSHTE